MVVGRREKTVPELLERKNQVWIDKTEKSLTQVSDTAKKATVTNKVYPTTYDPANPQDWDDTATGPFYDSSGREVEQVATINRKPVFVPKGGGSGSPVLGDWTLYKCTNFRNLSSWQAFQTFLTYAHATIFNVNDDGTLTDSKKKACLLYTSRCV